MKKIIMLLVVLCLLTGCGKYSEKDVVKDLEKKLDKNYKLSGELSINNNDEVYNYKVEVLYMKKDYYKVVLTNTSNDHTQIILKNDDGVYVLTPSLNKSFRFQSDWPYNNSQIYLINAIINDIKKDNKRKFTSSDNKYIIKTNVKYPNNTKLVNQKIVVSKDLKFEKVIVYDNNGSPVMNMIFDKIDYSPKISKSDFKLDNIIKNNNESVKETSNLEDTIYPLFVPSGTKLIDEKEINKDNGKRVIMNYDGEKSFVLVEETEDVFNEFTIIPSYGEPCLLMDTLGVASTNSLSWNSGGIDYYLVSDVLSQTEMMEVASSINGIVSTK